MSVAKLCNRIIFVSFLLLLAIVPVILTPWNYELFEFNKMIITYLLTVFIAGAWGIKMASQKEIAIRRTPFDIPIILFAASQLVSSLFSMDPHVSWFGYYSRFNGGMLSVFCYVILYYAFVSNWNDIQKLAREKSKPTRLFLTTIIGTAAIVSVYGVLERLGIDKHLWVQDVQNRIFSTLGQPNWLAAYLVVIIPITIGMALQQLVEDNSEKNKKFPLRTIILSVLTIMFYITLIFTRSRSGLAGLGVAGLVFGGGILLTKAFNKSIQKVLLAIGMLCLVFTFFNGSNVTQIDSVFSFTSVKNRLLPKKAPQPATQNATPEQPAGTLLEYGGTESGTIRKYVWQAAIKGWLANPKNILVGTGTETYAFAFFQYKPKEHNLTSEWDFLYNKAHNEYLNYLTTTGGIGIVSYLFFLGVIFMWYLLQFRQISSDTHKTVTNPTLSPVGIGLFAAWVSILVTNFFGFSVVIMQIFLFLIPALLLLLDDREEKHFTLSLSKFPRAVAITLLSLTIILSAVGVIWAVTYWIADSFFATGYRMSRAGQLADSYRSLSQAVILRPGEPVYYDELSVVLSGLSLASIQAGNATAAANFAQQSIAASDKALTISPNNVNFWKSRTKIYYGFSSLDPKFTQAAISSLEKAFSLSPLDPKIAYNLAVLYGRMGQNEKAIDILKKTTVMKPNYRDAYYALYVFYVEVKQPNLAKTVLEDYLKLVDPKDQDFKDRIREL